MLLFVCAEFSEDKRRGCQDCFIGLFGLGSCGLVRETSWDGWSPRPPEQTLQQQGVGQAPGADVHAGDELRAQGNQISAS